MDAVDGIYWRFVEKKRDFLSKNPRRGLMIKSLERMNDERKIKIYDAADEFIDKNTN